MSICLPALPLFSAAVVGIHVALLATIIVVLHTSE